MIFSFISDFWNIRTLLRFCVLFIWLCLKLISSKEISIFDGLRSLLRWNWSYYIIRMICKLTLCNVLLLNLSLIRLFSSYSGNRVLLISICSYWYVWLSIMKLWICARTTGYQNRTFFELISKLFAKRISKLVNFFRWTQETSNHTLFLLPTFHLLVIVKRKILL